MKNALMTVGEIAKAMQVSVRTMQYYDREGLLPPSEMSDGGRRLYAEKDMVRLHQILSFKALGFSLSDIKEKLLPLDTPEDVLAALDAQGMLIAAEIEGLRAAQLLLSELSKKVSESKHVDFAEYANIVRLLQTDCKKYELWDRLDDMLSDITGKRYSCDMALRVEALKEHRALQGTALSLMARGVAPDAPEAMALAERWQGLVDKISGGSPEALERLKALNEDRSGWIGELAEKQEIVHDFVIKMFEVYYQKRACDAHTERN